MSSDVLTHGAVDTSSIYVNGAWTAASGKDVIEVVNPSTGEVLGAVPECSEDDVRAAVGAARAAFETWSSTSVATRAAALRQISAELSERAEEIALVAAKDIGTTIAYGTYMHGKLPATTFANMADNIEALELETRRGALAILREPVGVVGCITPWNYPLHQISAKVAPALAAGCTVVVKPSEVAPLTAWLFADIIHRSGLPAGVFNLISGSGASVGEALVRHSDVDMVSFTGSVRAGRRVGELAGAAIKRVTLELGGKSPNVVLEDAADLPAIVESAVRSAYSNAGQTCSALTRLIVPRSTLTEVEGLAKAAAEAMRVGDPADPDTTLGPVVSEAQYERVLDYIRRGVEEGAKLVTGGLDRPEGTGGYFVAPTVFSDVAPSMTIAQEEIFGPVLSILPYDTEDEAVEIANGTSYGLSGGVWSGDIQHAERIARRLRTGQVKINGGAFNPIAPFGGYRQSGVGRELGEFGLEEFFEIKALTY